MVLPLPSNRAYVVFANKKGSVASFFDPVNIFQPNSYTADGTEASADNQAMVFPCLLEGISLCNRTDTTDKIKISLYVEGPQDAGVAKAYVLENVLIKPYETIECLLNVNKLIINPSDKVYLEVDMQSAIIDYIVSYQEFIR